MVLDDPDGELVLNKIILTIRFAVGVDAVVVVVIVVDVVVVVVFVVIGIVVVVDVVVVFVVAASAAAVLLFPLRFLAFGCVLTPQVHAHDFASIPLLSFRFDLKLSFRFSVFAV
jgi:hypothetical protein